MITNYGELKTEIANFISRADLTSEIPTFIQMAVREADSNRNGNWESGFILLTCL